MSGINDKSNFRMWFGLALEHGVVDVEEAVSSINGRYLKDYRAKLIRCYDDIVLLIG